MLLFILQFSPELWSLVLGVIAAIAAFLNYNKNETIKLIDTKIKYVVTEIKAHVATQLVDISQNLHVCIDKNGDNIDRIMSDIKHQRKYDDLATKILNDRLTSLEQYLEDRDKGYKIRRGDRQQSQTNKNT